MTEIKPTPDEFRFAGHQTFPLRTAWLPKAALLLRDGFDPLSDIVDGVVKLGLGKNMVEALRCWMSAYGIAERTVAGWELTHDGRELFGRDGLDPFLEDPQTLWWLHWRIATQAEARFFAWELMFNRWVEPTFTSSTVVSAFAKEAERSGRSLSEVTLKQHFDVWLRTYFTPRSNKLGEDQLDSPLATLGLVRPAGEREGSGRREAVYKLDLSPKRGISQALFQYCLMEWWDRQAPQETTVPFFDVAAGSSSPGRIFRMPEDEVRSRLAALSRSGDLFALRESLNQQQVQKTKEFPARALRLKSVYDHHELLGKARLYG